MERSDSDRCVKISWPVDSRKLRGMDKQVVSPSFELCPGMPCKLMIKPRIAAEKKRQANFKTAGGRGYCEVKCEADASVAPPKVRFHFSIGSGLQQQSARGPVVHDFANNTVGRLPSDIAEWNFSSAVDTESSTLMVCLELAVID